MVAFAHVSLFVVARALSIIFAFIIVMTVSTVTGTLIVIVFKVEVFVY